MSERQASPSPSHVVRLLEERRDGIPAAQLIDELVGQGYEVDQVASMLRGMLNSGEIGVGPEMDICLLKQTA